ncbi:aromatic ring-hydroxylating oxygenase subunit alpha [Zavarzinia sp. CC-PAN008]|uniref:aromatic ring-hydroxylating oxygenase subunit alpha n=1 Tax=Zavarzinia sp. CC-PAN008 TaxID=3243332 RepID=UPI003F746C98
MDAMVEGGPFLALNPKFYSGPETWERERHAIFAREWQMIAPLDLLRKPGDYAAIDIAGWSVFVIVDREGAIQGYHNLCRHRAGPFFDHGRGTASSIRCQYHAWIYNTDGTLRGAPHFGACAGFRNEDWSLHRIKVAVWRGLVFVNLDLEAGPVEDGLGGMVHELRDTPMETYRWVESHTLEMACNWKTYTDNFVEGYHIPAVHPAFDDVIEFEQFIVRTSPRTIAMQAPQRAGSIYNGVWLWRWPNMTLSTFNGGMNTSRIAPVGPDRALLHYDFYFADTSEATAAERRRTIDRNLEIVREDYGICERVQKNLEAGRYLPGPLSPRQEEGVRLFQDHVRRALAG